MGFKLAGGRSSGGWFYGVVILLGIALVIGGCAAAQRLTLETKTVKIQDKAIKRECSNNSCHDTYMIYTDKGVYKDKDNLFFLKFNSSDLYGQLQRGHTYKCRSNGFRVPIFSHYRNMLDCEEAE